MKYKISIFAVVGAIAATSAHATCTIQYACGTGATGTAPTQHTVSSGTTFTPSDNTCTREGYVFSHYIAKANKYSYAMDGVAKPGETYTIPFNGTYNCSTNMTITLTAQWVAANTNVPTSKSYTDTQLAGRQPAFTGSSTAKLILFSDTTDGEYGERDVVTSLGSRNSTTGQYPAADTAATANEVPTNGAVKTGVDYKQATVTGTAGYVAMYNTNAKMSGDAKPIYGATTQYSNALVEADTLNNAIADAVNSELTQVDENGAPSNTGTLWQINTVDGLAKLFGRTYLDARINGTNYCYRNLNGNNNSTGNNLCGTGHEMSYIGNTGSKSGKWGAVFPYGDVSGISVCSATDGGAYGAVATSAQNTSLSNEYNSQAGNGNLGSGQKNCWCKMENPVASSWVFSYSSDFSAGCASVCAIKCVDNVLNDADFRGALFGAVQ